ncbi:hypothetical protein RI367_001294 [Sorochytrium milnesiophthora]
MTLGLILHAVDEFIGHYDQQQHQSQDGYGYNSGSVSGHVGYAHGGEESGTAPPPPPPASDYQHAGGHQDCGYQQTPQQHQYTDELHGSIAGHGSVDGHFDVSHGLYGGNGHETTGHGNAYGHEQVGDHADVHAGVNLGGHVDAHASLCHHAIVHI